MHRCLVKRIPYIIFLILLCWIGFILYRLAENTGFKLGSKLQHSYARSIEGELQRISLVGRDTIFVFVLDSECNLCTIEVEELLSNNYLFKPYKIVLLFRDNVNKIKEIHSEYKIYLYPKVRLMKIDEIETDEMFKKCPTPSVFIFDLKGKVIWYKKGYSKPNILIDSFREVNEN